MQNGMKITKRIHVIPLIWQIALVDYDDKFE